MVVLFAGAATASIIAAASRQQGRLSIPTFLVLLLVGLFVEHRRIGMNARLAASATFLPVLFSVVVLGPMAGVCVAATSMLVHAGRPFTRWFVWTCSGATAAGLGGALGWTVRSMFDDPHSVSATLAVTSSAGVIDMTAGLGLATLTLWLRRGPWQEALRTAAWVTLSGTLVYVPMVAALAYAYFAVSIWTEAVLFLPIIAAQQLFVLYRQQRETADRLTVAVTAAEAANEQLESTNELLAEKNRELEHANLSFAASLIVSLDARDHYTAGHSAAVAVYSRDLAAAIGLAQADQDEAYLAGLMHDIGKVGLPPGILEKAEALSDEEQALMQQHVLIGERILAPVKQFGGLAPAVRHHHERFDGRGYPDGVAGEDIPLMARIVAAADTYNAMTSNRPYRAAMDPNTAIANLVAIAGAQLDPVLAPTLAGLLTSADAAYRVARRKEFVIDFHRLDHSDVFPALGAVTSR